MMPLLGKVALVTGSTRRNGKAIAKRLAAAGAAVMITGYSSIDAAREVAGEIESDHGPGRSAAYIADVRDALAVAALIEGTVAQFGRLDILINNAGVRRDGMLESTTLEAWHFIMQTVLDGAFLCAQAAAPHLAQSGAGRIINIGRTWAEGHYRQLRCAGADRILRRSARTCRPSSRLFRGRAIAARADGNIGRACRGDRFALR
jgi:3-oxoacyl-[acyl-carrier protein] reductase